jgi:mRNA interferase RelE/StbE
MVEVVVSDRAADWLRDAEPDVRDRITNKLHDITEFPDHYLKRLSGSPYYRLRVGDYRVIIDWRKDDGKLFVREVGHCRSVYD